VPSANDGTMQPLEHHVDERKFLRDAAADSLADVELGKRVAQKGSSDAVRQFGKKMGSKAR